MPGMRLFIALPPPPEPPPPEPPPPPPPGLLPPPPPEPPRPQSEHPPLLPSGAETPPLPPFELPPEPLGTEPPPDEPGEVPPLEELIDCMSSLPRYPSPLQCGQSPCPPGPVPSSQYGQSPSATVGEGVGVAVGVGRFMGAPWVEFTPCLAACLRSISASILAFRAFGSSSVSGSFGSRFVALSPFRERAGTRSGLRRRGTVLKLSNLIGSPR
jgi:hypothetical protein